MNELVYTGFHDFLSPIAYGVHLHVKKELGDVALEKARYSWPWP